MAQHNAPLGLISLGPNMLRDRASRPDPPCWADNEEFWDQLRLPESPHSEWSVRNYIAGEASHTYRIIPHLFPCHCHHKTSVFTDLSEKKSNYYIPSLKVVDVKSVNIIYAALMREVPGSL